VLYALIHFERDEELWAACREIARVLAPGGEVVVTYHRGKRVLHAREMWGAPVDLGFWFLPDRTVTAGLADAGLNVTAQTHREP
jgi:hypothetical protein